MGILATGMSLEVRRRPQEVLAGAPPRFILAADCTVPAGTLWDKLRAAVDVAHGGAPAV